MTSLSSWIQLWQERLEYHTQLRGRTVYTLPASGDIQFIVPRRSQAIKISLNAVWTGGESAGQDPMSYELKYQLSASDGTVMEQGRQPFQPQNTLFHDSNGDLVHEFLLGQSSQDEVGDTDLFHLAIPSTGKESFYRLSLSLGASSPSIDKVFVRVHGRQIKNSPVNPHQWQRTAASARSRMTAGNVFPVALMQPEEIKNVMRQSWVPIPPEGIHGIEFEKVTLFIRDVSGLQVMSTFQSKGNTANLTPLRQQVLSIPATGVLELEIQRTDHSTTVDMESIVVELNWRSQEQYVKRVGTIVLETQSATASFALTEGDLTLTSNGAVDVRPLWKDPSGEHLLEPSTVKIETYYCSTEHDLIFRVHSIPDRRTPFRIVLRAVEDVAKESPSPVAVSMDYQVQDKDGNLVAEGHFEKEADWSLLDYTEDQDSSSRVSEPISCHLNLPPEAYLLTLSPVRQPLLVKVYNRPPDTVVDRFVQNQTGLPGTDTVVNQPLWFNKKSVYHHLLKKDGHLRTVLSQTNTEDQTNQDFLSGNFVYDGLLPSQRYTGRYLLVPASSGETIRTESLKTRFLPLKSNGAVSEVQLAGDAWERTVSPQLLIFAESAQASEFSVQIDEQSFHFETQALYQTIQLPPLNTGNHAIRISGPSLKEVYMNQRLEPSLEARIRRFAVELNDQAAKYRFAKENDEEIINIRVFSARTPGAAAAAILLPAKLDGTGIQKRDGLKGWFHNWTWVNRSYTFDFQEPFRYPVIGLSDRLSTDSLSAVFPLHDDLPPGPYELSIHSQSAGRVFVVVYRLIPGVRKKFNTWMEVTDDNNNEVIP